MAKSKARGAYSGGAYKKKRVFHSIPAKALVFICTGVYRGAIGVPWSVRVYSFPTKIGEVSMDFYEHLWTINHLDAIL